MEKVVRRMPCGDVVTIELKTFKEWLKDNPEVEVNELAKCDSCGGNGKCSCHCGDEHSCGQCDGTGVDDDRYDQYLKQRDRDIRKWEMSYMQRTPHPGMDDPDPDYGL